MKQKLFLLMVLVAGLVACSKDEDESNVYQRGLANNHMNYLGIGEFEGDWILNNEKIGTGSLEVYEIYVILVPPSDTLINYALQLLKEKVVCIPGVNIYDAKINESFNSANGELNHYGYMMMYDAKPYVSDDEALLLYKPQGYSGNKNYFEISGGVICSGYIYYDEEADYYQFNQKYLTQRSLGLITDQPVVAIYDKDTELWTARIALTKLGYYDMQVNIHTIIDLPSPIYLTFVATKKVRDLLPE